MECMNYIIDTRDKVSKSRGPSLFEMSSIDAEIYLKFEIHRNVFEIQ